jgi:hypothetical protein
MTNEMLRSDDIKAVRLVVALELSLSKWGLSAAVEGQPRKRVKAAENWQKIRDRHDFSSSNPVLPRRASELLAERPEGAR